MPHAHRQLVGVFIFHIIQWLAFVKQLYLVLIGESTGAYINRFVRFSDTFGVVTQEGDTRVSLLNTHNTPQKRCAHPAESALTLNANPFLVTRF
jgi:hypothetical protein